MAPSDFALPSSSGSNSCGVLVVDSRGAIVSCSLAAAALFACSRYDLESGAMWSLITDLAAAGKPPAYRDGKLGNLRDDGTWQRFHAVDTNGYVFPVDIAMSPMHPAAVDMFVLRLRHAAGG